MLKMYDKTRIVDIVQGWELMKENNEYSLFYNDLYQKSRNHTSAHQLTWFIVSISIKTKKPYDETVILLFFGRKHRDFSSLLDRCAHP